MINLIGIEKHDGGVICISFDPKKFGDQEGQRNFLENPYFQSRLAEHKGWFRINPETWAAIKAHPERESRKQIYYDGVNLKIDLTWEQRLMPVHIIKKRHLKKLNKNIQEHLNSNSPNLMDILTLSQEREECKAWNDLRWHQQALINLDARVSDGDPDKPKIRNQLLSKISQLKNG